MTAKKPPEEKQQHRAHRTWLGNGRRALMHCPWQDCPGELRVIAHRRSTVRLECEQRAQRFSVPAEASYCRLRELHTQMLGA